MQPEPCYCTAYAVIRRSRKTGKLRAVPRPHRPGAGQCRGGDFRCTECGAYFDEFPSETISGRVGHIDNWLPDDGFQWCPNCHEEGSIEEVDHVRRDR
jgi:hypothetical protein